LNEPSEPIRPEVTALTGITDEMVAMHRISDDDVTAFVDEAAIVIAQNSRFDRRFAEGYWPVFEHKGVEVRLGMERVVADVEGNGLTMVHLATLHGCRRRASNRAR
jgi:hypothetical protein